MTAGMQPFSKDLECPECGKQIKPNMKKKRWECSGEGCAYTDEITIKVESMNSNI